MPIDVKMVQEAAEFYAQNKRMPPWYDVPADAVSRLLHAAPEMYALLKDIGTGTSGPIKYCPSCGLGLYRHHAPDCRLAAVLKAVEGEVSA